MSLEVASTVPNKPGKNRNGNAQSPLRRRPRRSRRRPPVDLQRRPLNILSSAVTDGVREGFEKLAGDKDIRAIILAGQSEKSMIGGADIKEMAKLDQKSAEAFITRLRDLCEAVRIFRRRDRAASRLVPRRRPRSRRRLRFPDCRP
jgi:hypothetical protein